MSNSLHPDTLASRAVVTVTLDEIKNPRIRLNLRVQIVSRPPDHSFRIQT